MTDAAGRSRILTLVFTDLVDSTALKQRQGDQAVGALIERHRALVRQLAAESGGRIVDWAGDGCFLTFETPSAAVSFALRLPAAIAAPRSRSRCDCSRRTEKSPTCPLCAPACTWAR